MIVLPWPPKELNPNQRCHWAVKAKAVKQYREQAYWMAKGVFMSLPNGPLKLALAFYPPDKRKRDDDNMLASVKAARDGIAQALGIDDNKMRFSVEVCRPVKGGKVEVTIEALK